MTPADEWNQYGYQEPTISPEKQITEETNILWKNVNGYKPRTTPLSTKIILTGILTYSTVESGCKKIQQSIKDLTHKLQFSYTNNFNFYQEITA